MDVAQGVLNCKRHNRLPIRSDVPCPCPINLGCQRIFRPFTSAAMTDSYYRNPQLTQSPVLLIMVSPTLILLTFNSSLPLLASLVGIQ